MSNLIVNGDFANQQLAPWVTNSQQPPEFEVHKPGGYSVKIEPNTEILQLLKQKETKPYLLTWQLDARIDSKAHLGGAVFVLFTMRVDQEFYIESAYITDLEDEWKTFSFTANQPFPPKPDDKTDPESYELYIQIINARKVDLQGAVSAPVRVANISTSTLAQS